jgi:hypothetical protein
MPTSATLTNLSNQFARAFPVPIDRDFVFTTTTARNNYLSDAGTSGIAYTGMIVADLETNKVYLLNSSRAWQEVGISVNEVFGASNSGMLFKTGDNTFAVRGLSSGNNIEITNPSGLAANPSIALSSSVTGLISLSATTVTFTSGTVSSKLAVSGSLTLNGRDITTSIEAAPNTNTANFNLSVGSITNVGTNGGPSYYGTYDQGGNIREIMHSGVTTLAMRGGNFSSDDQLIKTYRSTQTATAEGPGFGFRLASRENIGKSYPLTFNATTGITASGNVIHGFQIGDPLKFANDTGLPTALSSGVTYYVVGTGSTTFSVALAAGGSAISVSTIAGTTSTYSAYDYGSFARVENSGNTADSTTYGAVSYNYRIGKFEITNDEYVEFLNAAARDDHDAANTSYFVNTVDMGLYNPLMETELPNNGISRNASFPDYYYASLRGMNKKPVVFISYVDAMRFANWLHNGKPVSTRYKVCSIVNGLSSTATVTLANHGFINGDLITFNCADGGTFGGTLAKNTVYKVVNKADNTFDVQTTGDANVTFSGTGTFYVKKSYSKTTNLNSGAYTLDNNESTAESKIAIARYWIPTENEWYKAAYYDPAKGGVGVPGYWNYPTRSDTVPSGVVADANGNGTYNPGGTVPGHYHSSYDISDFADRIDNLLADGNGTQVIYSPNAVPASIVVNVTGIPLSTVVDVRATATEVNYLSGVNPGTGVASRALVLNANKSISGISNLMADTGVFTSGSFGSSTSLDSASTLRVGGTGVSLSGHKHYYTAGQGFNDIPNFCSGVADCVSTQLVVSTGLRADTVSSNLQLALSGQAATLHTFTSNGIIVRSGGSANNGTFAARSIASGANINVTNGTAIDGNPTIALSPSVTGLTDLTVDQIKIDGSTISTTGNNDSITLAPNGTGDVNVDADTLRVGDSNSDATITTNGTGDLTLNTNSGTNSSSITIADAANGDITLTAHGTGEVNINKVDIDNGNIDGTTIGSSSAAAGTFTVVTVDNTKIDSDIIYYNNTARVDLGSSETVINNPGANVDFRVEGSGNANLLFVDAELLRVGIGTNSPLNTFSVSGIVNLNSGIIAPNIGASTSSNSLVTLDAGNFKTRSVDSRVWGTSLVDGDGNGSAGGIPYWSDSNSLTQSSNLFWDSSNSRLGIGTSTPLMSLDVRGDAGVSGNFSVGGNLTVTGTTVITNVDIMRIKDPIILLGSGTAIADATNDRGLSLALSASVTGFLGWSYSASEFIMLSSGVPGANSGTYSPGTYGAFRAGNINAQGVFGGSGLTVSGALDTGVGATKGQINLNGSNGNFISWNTNGQGAPTTAVRSSGTKLVLYPSLIASTVDTAIGTSDTGQTLWQSIKSGAGASFKWYGGATEVASLTDGNFTVNGTITSKASAITAVSGFAVFDNDPSSTSRTLSYRSVSNIRSDLGASVNTASTLVLRDSSGDFSARNITITGVSGISTVTAGSITANNVWTSTSISGVNNTTYLLNFIIDGGTP